MIPAYLTGWIIGVIGGFLLGFWYRSVWDRRQRDRWLKKVDSRVRWDEEDD